MGVGECKATVYQFGSCAHSTVGDGGADGCEDLGERDEHGKDNELQISGGYM
jgi:hypothetical protein